MKIILKLACVLLSVASLISGCASNREAITKSSIGSRQDVFTEAQKAEIPSGKALADFKFTVKSNAYYFIGTYGKHSDPPYRVHLNIDGQPTVLEAEPVLEDKSPVDSSIPESGIGWKYHFNKQVILAPGTHRVTIALPVDDVIVEQEITLRNGINTINLTPVYKRTLLRPYKGENFKAGIKSIQVNIN